MYPHKKQTHMAPHSHFKDTLCNSTTSDHMEAAHHNTVHVSAPGIRHENAHV